MVTKQEWRDWREHTVTKELLNLIETGNQQATVDLISKRGEVSDYERGAILTFEEIKNTILYGDNLFSLGEKE